MTQAGLPSTVLSAIECHRIAEVTSQRTIDNAFNENKCIIFAGGTGNPFFTTDTNAVLRALQMKAEVVWKATKVDGVYEGDPLKDEQSKLYKKIGHQEVLDKKLGIMDATSIRLAQEENLSIRVFNLFAPKSLTQALENPDFGSTIGKQRG